MYNNTTMNKYRVDNSINDSGRLDTIKDLDKKYTTWVSTDDKIKISLSFNSIHFYETKLLLSRNNINNMNNIRIK